MKTIKVYWSTSLKNGKKNFGDWLSPVLCEAISKKTVVWAPPEKCDLAAVGSVLRKFKKNWLCHRVHVWGSGLLEEGKKYKSKHYYHAIRGKQSAEHITNQKITILGDPGLLCPILLPEQKIVKKHMIGIIPHYKDQDNVLVKNFVNDNKHVVFIDIFSDTIDFIKKVCECDIILSSSLHGLIVADAFHIPNAWILLSNEVRGNGFKFFDYYSAFGIDNVKPFDFNSTTKIEDISCIAETYTRENMEEIKRELSKAFPF